MERVRRLGLELCLLLSGFSALLYETVWTREFAAVFGTSALSVATVLAAYMGGLALGAGLARRLAWRVTRPVLAYGVLELSIAVGALLVPLAIRGSTVVLVASFGGQPSPPESGGLATAAFYLVASFAILVFPTACMGATLPLLVRHDVRSEREIGSRVGRLYAANTAGAVLGVLVSAFLLLPELGLRRSVLVGAGINGVVFLMAAFLSRGTSAPAHSVATPRTVGRSRDERFILLLVLLSGATTFGYEVLWTRLLAHLLGGSTYAFATMLASFLTGIAGGSVVAGRIAATPRRAAFGFAVAQLGIAALSYAGFALLDLLPESPWLFALRLDAGPASDAPIAMAVLLPSALCIGATFPFAVRAIALRPADAAPASARVYSWNTVGSIAGCIGAGFWWIPWLGHAGFLGAAAALNLCIGAAALLLVRPVRPARFLVPAAALVALALAPPSTPWRLLRTSPLRTQPAEGEVAYFAVGRTANVLLTDSSGEWHLRTNGLPESMIPRRGGRITRNRTAAWLGALPFLARPELGSMLVVGLGGGIVLEGIPRSVPQVDVVEIEPHVAAANHAVAGERDQDVLADPRIRLTVNDARGALVLTDHRYDAIVSQPSHPWSGAAASLYTQEFFELVRSRLAPGGVFVQWIGLAFVDEALLRSLAATLCAVFPEVRAYAPERGALLFLASDRPLQVETEVERALAREPDALVRLGVRAPEDVAAALVLDAEGVRALARGSPVIRDDRNLLEMRSPRILGRALNRPGGERLLEAHEPNAWDCERLDCAYLVRRMLAADRHRTALRTAEQMSDPGARAVALAHVLSSRGHRYEARGAFEQALAFEGSRSEATAGMVLARRDDLVERAPETKELERTLDGFQAAVVESWRREAEGDWQGVRSRDRELAGISFRDPLFSAAAQLRIAWRLESGGPDRLREALDLSEDLVAFQEEPDTVLQRARAAARAGFTSPAVAELDTVSSALLARSRSAGRGPTARAVLELWSELPTDGASAESRERMKKLERLVGLAP